MAEVIQGRLDRYDDERASHEVAYGDARGAYYRGSMELDLRLLINLILGEPNER